MIVLLQVASAPICSYRLAYLHACGQGGVEGLPGEAGAAPASGWGSRGQCPLSGWLGLLEGFEVGAVLVLISCFSHP